MVVGIKDASKLMGIVIVALCAVLVCTMFLNYRLDMAQIENQIQPGPQQMLYDAQNSTANMVTALSGGCLLATSVVMLIFYIKHYIDTHKKELGILKALGCSRIQIARNFWVFGSSIFLGTALGFGGGYLLAPMFYTFNNEGDLIPDVELTFHPKLAVYMVALPTLAFGILAILYACRKLKTPVNHLLKDLPHEKSRKHRSDKESYKPFLEDLKSSALRSHKTLTFFVIFASFCFSAMTQMSFSMDELSSEMMGVMVMMIGLTLAFTTLYMAITTVISGNKKSIAVMRTFGYSQKECTGALLGCYRPVAYLGFVIGTIYQYALLRIAVDVVFAGMEGVPEFSFDWTAFFISLAVFAVLYEILMYVYSKKIKKISVKEIMME